jgi:hypothetical protein
LLEEARGEPRTGREVRCHRTVADECLHSVQNMPLDDVDANEHPWHKPFVMQLLKVCMLQA